MLLEQMVENDAAAHRYAPIDGSRVSMKDTPYYYYKMPNFKRRRRGSTDVGKTDQLQRGRPVEPTAYLPFAYNSPCLNQAKA
jgi:hypothetical protein